jgi:hypothetical protein
MANITIPNLPASASISGSFLLESVTAPSGGTSVRITVDQIAAYAGNAYGLTPIPTNYLLGNVSGVSAIPTANTLTAYMDAAFGTTQGLLLYRGSTNWEALSAGNDGEVLQTHGSGASPTWYAIPSSIGGGTVTQINTTGNLTGGPITVTGTLNTVQNPTFTTSVTSPFFVGTKTISGSSSTGAFSYGTLGYSDTNIFASYQTSINSYAQTIVQNTNSGASASADLTISNDLGTATTYYGNFGMNSSGFSGTGSLGAANNVYLSSTSSDLVIGTTTSNAIKFVVNNGATDAASISSAGVFTIANASITAGTVTLTSATVPTIYGGTTASSSLTLQSTSGVGTTDSIIFKVGNNGATTALTIGTGTAASLTFGGTAQRFLADFSNATVNSRFAFQASTLNAATGVYVLPNGSSTAASWQAINAADPTNASKILIATNGSTDVQLVSGINGTGTYLPLSFYTGGSQQAQIGTTGNWGFGGNATTFVGLAVPLNITGATSAYGQRINGNVQSGVTTLAAAYFSNIALANASFTTTDLVHFLANPPSGGAGSTATNQYGFRADSTLGSNGAATVTNSYGFYSNLASASNKWNFFANGTANNAFAGNVAIGSTTAPTVPLAVTGAATISTSLAIGGATIGANALAVTGSVLFNTALGVASGGTGATTFTTNGVLYGNTTSAIQVTAQGAANSILTANAGAPSFSASPTIGTSVTVPLVIGGTATSSTLTLQSTSGVGATDSVVVKVGNNGAVTSATFNTAGVATSTNWYNTSTQTATNTATLSAAQISGPFLLGTPTATASYTLPLASAVDTALGTPPNETGWEFVVFTTAAFAITLLTNTGWTLVGSMATGATANSFARFRIRKTGAAAYSIYRIS